MGRSSGMKHFCSFLLFCGACFRVLVISSMEKLKLKCKGFFCSRCCLGCCKKPPAIIWMDEPSKGPRTQDQDQVVHKVTDDFWSSSTLEKDHSAAPSGPRSSAGSEIGAAEFVNQGLVIWNQIREQWVGNKRPEHHKEVRGPTISVIATYDSLLGNNELFTQPIPLREMVEFLVEIWEEYGLYD